MKKFIPFKKEIQFKTQVAEITSISLEHNIHKCNDNEISGNFIISGEYKINDTSTQTKDFKFDLPFSIEMSDIYDIENVTIDIDDFYYEIKNMETLEVNITLLIDKIIEKPLIKEDRLIGEIKEECYEPEEPVELEKEIDKNKEIDRNDKEIDKQENDKNEKEQKNIFSFQEDDEYSKYIVYIVRENDTIDTILEKYKITIDKLKEYNDLKTVQKGDKIIIPNV